MSENQGTKKCKHCKTEIPKDSKICPNCKKKQGGVLKWIVIAIVVLAVIGAAVGGGNQDKNASDKKPDKVQQTEHAENTESPEEDEKGAETTDESQEPDVPVEYKSALKQAETYSDVMHMSKQGIYDQLVSEYGGQFSAEAAQYAVDNLQADYNANALEQAKQYQETMAMSPEAIRDQLTSEYGGKFTQEEADYAIANLPQ